MDIFGISEGGGNPSILYFPSVRFPLPHFHSQPSYS